MASCAGATTCATLASTAALPIGGSVLPLPVAAETWLAPATPRFHSFIPDGLRRPPRFLA